MSRPTQIVAELMGGPLDGMRQRIVVYLEGEWDEERGHDAVVVPPGIRWGGMRWAFGGIDWTADGRVKRARYMFRFEDQDPAFYQAMDRHIRMEEIS